MVKFTGAENQIIFIQNQYVKIMKKHLYLTVSFLVFSVLSTVGQYNFETVYHCGCTAVKNQQRTGTCWSFSTVSYLESELLRMGKPAMDLSEMYVVRNIYADKARNYVLRQGKANFGQGSLAHDVIRAFKMAGMVPESVYNGLTDGEKVHDHGDMEAALKGMLDGIIKNRNRPNPKWQEAFEALIDVYMGKVPQTFTYEGKTYTPQSFAKELGIHPDDYVSFTSYTHHPFYENCILEIPDNYSNGSYFNVPVSDLRKIVDNALAHDFTVSWDGDVSEKGFSQRHGLAVLPADPDREDRFENPGPEIAVTQELRQQTFLTYETTDDHLMHIIGMAKDQNGTPYYIVKNSWGETGAKSGYVYMSAPYFDLKTVGIMVHKDAIPEDIRSKLNL